MVSGGKRRAGAGQFFEPTVLTGCDHTMTVMKEEIFGPIVPIQKVASEDEAVRLANDSHLGLNAYVFTKNREKGKRIAQRIEAGSVIVNDVLVNYAAAEAPFGGIKQSGFGRVHGDDALRDMCDARHVFSGRVPGAGRRSALVSLLEQGLPLADAHAARGLLARQHRQAHRQAVLSARASSARRSSSRARRASSAKVKPSNASFIVTGSRWRAARTDVRKCR